MGHMHRLAEELAPLQAHLAEVEAELSELTATRNALRSILRHIEPPETKRNGSHPPKVSDESLTRLIDYLREERPDSELYASQLEPLVDFMPKSHIRPALDILRERGQLVLSSVGAGGRHNFKVVR